VDASSLKPQRRFSLSGRKPRKAVIVDPAGTRTVLSGVNRPYFRDAYHYFISASWPLVLLLIALTFMTANTLFALCYLVDGGIQNARPGSFSDMLFFSIQTMATIGYGVMAPRSAVANVVVSIEAFTGLMGLAMVTGLIFAKFSRPTARVRFSKFAVVSTHNGTPCLMFRMANERTNRIVEAEVHVVLFRLERTTEGDRFRRLHDLGLLRYHHAFFAFSWTAIHPIDDRSPLKGATRESLMAEQAFITVSVTGLDDTVSQTVHARHTYGVDDILWGARFVDILETTAEGHSIIDYSRFDDVAESPDA